MMRLITEIPGVRLTPLKHIQGANGDVLHLLRAGDPGFRGFGEAYISTVTHGMIKGWRKHRVLTMNLVVPVGEIEFRAVDDRTSGGALITGAISLSLRNYQRLTVPNGIWLSFRGVEPGLNLLINLADVIHDSKESESVPIDHANFAGIWAD